jgi:hypothetical protein
MSDSINKYSLLGDESILYEYEGLVNKEVLLDTLPKIESILDSLGVNRQNKRKIVNIAIETLQNLQLHSFQIEENKYNLPPLFVVAKDDKNITITIGNLIHTSEQQVLEDKLNKINSLNDEEIKFLYGVIMKQTVVKFSTKGGAGLGLIDMKKKSGNPLTFCFKQIDDKVSYFNLKISVPG